MSLYTRNNIWYVDALVDGKRVRSSTGILYRTGDSGKDLQNRQQAERILLQKRAELARMYAGGEKIHDWLVGQRRQLQRWRILLPKDFSWSDITLQFLQKLVKGMETNGILKNRRIPGQEPEEYIEPYSSSTIHSYLDEITTMVKRAAKRGECEFPQWDRKDIYNKPRTAKNKKVIQTNEEIERLLKTDIVLKNDILGEVWDTIHAWKFVLCTGLRFGDIEELMWEDIENDELYIKQQKTSRFLNIPLGKVALDILDVVKKNRKCIQENEKVFNLPNHVSTLEQLEKWREAAGVRSKVLWHGARRKYATLLHESGVDIYTISKLLGHSDVRVTQRYVQLSNSIKKQAINILNDVLNRFEKAS